MQQYNLSGFDNEGSDIIQPLYQYNGPMTNVNIDNALASILDKFDSDYILDTINYALANKFRPYDQPMPNVVYGFDQQFIQLLATYTANNDDISAKRIDVFRRIIDILTNSYNLNFNDNDEIDYYAAAYYLYQFLISDFTNNIIVFFTNFLIKERTGLFGMLDLKDTRKLDTSSNYGVKIFADMKLGVIYGNLNNIVEQIKAFDIDLYTILDMVYADKNVVRYIYSIVQDRGNFFRDYYVNYLLDPKIGAELQTLIKLNLQTVASTYQYPEGE